FCCSVVRTHLSYTLSLHDALPIYEFCDKVLSASKIKYVDLDIRCRVNADRTLYTDPVLLGSIFQNLIDNAYKYSKPDNKVLEIRDRKSTRLNSSHVKISYAVFCLK